MLHRIISYFRRRRSNIEAPVENTNPPNPPDPNQIINPQAQQVFYPGGYATIIPVINTAPSHQNGTQYVRGNRHLERTRREGLTPKQIQRMNTRDTKLINEFAVLTSGTAILAYNAASVPGFTLDPCMVQSSATLLGGLFFLYYINTSELRHTRFLDNRLVKVGILCVLLSLCSILINSVTAALNYNSRFWMIGSSMTVCVVPNSTNSTTTTSAIGSKKHHNVLFVFCYLFCLLISLLPFLRLLIIVLDSWVTSIQSEDRQEENAREQTRLQTSEREARQEIIRIQTELNNSTSQVTRLERQLTEADLQNRSLRELYAHHGSSSNSVALDLVHVDGNCRNPRTQIEPLSSRNSEPQTRRVSFRTGNDSR